MPARRQRLHGPPLVREAALPDNAIMDSEARTIRASFSSEEPVIRRSFFEDPWVEILGHDPSEVDLERLMTSAPVFYNHNRFDAAMRIGVVERAWLEGGRGMAEIRISKREDVTGIWQDIQDGVLRNVSVGYRIHERVLEQSRENEPDIYRVTSWEPMEISMVDIPADPTVGVGRSEEPATYHITTIDDEEDDSMSRKNEAQDAGQPTVGSENQPTHVDDQDRERAIEQARQDAIRQETARRNDVRSVFERFQDRPEIRSVMDACLDDPTVNVNAARQQLLDALGKGVEPAGDPNARVSPGESEVEKFARGAESALMARAGLAKDDAANNFRGFTLLELARHCLTIRNIQMGR